MIFLPGNIKHLSDPQQTRSPYFPRLCSQAGPIKNSRSTLRISEHDHCPLLHPRRNKTHTHTLPPSRPTASSSCMSGLILTTVSGFLKVKGFERTCLHLGNTCRDGALWKMSVQRFGLPTRLAKQIWHYPKTHNNRRRTKGASDQAAGSRLI